MGNMGVYFPIKLSPPLRKHVVVKFVYAELEKLNDFFGKKYQKKWKNFWWPGVVGLVGNYTLTVKTVYIEFPANLVLSKFKVILDWNFIVRCPLKVTGGFKQFSKMLM